MRRLVLAAALVAAATPALAARAPATISPDPMTVSGRFDLPRARPASAGRARLGDVKLDPTLARTSKQDGAALQAAVRAAVSRSLANFGYLAAEGSDGTTGLDVELLPLSVAPGEGATEVTARLRISATGAHSACFARQAEGRFRVLARERSGGGQRAAAVGVSLAFALLGDYSGGGQYLPDQLTGASAANKARNALREAGPGEGVAPGFGEARVLAYGASAATQLALADYLRQLGDDPACSAGATDPES